MINYTAFRGTGIIADELAGQIVGGNWDDYAFFQTSATDSVLVYCPSLVWIDSDTMQFSGANIITFHAAISSSTTGADHPYFYTVSRQIEDVTISGVSTAIVYSNAAGYPDLREGVSKYAWFICALLVGCGCWVLLDRIFRRLY